MGLCFRKPSNRIDLNIKLIKMQFGPLSSRQAIDNRFKELRVQSRQELLSQIYGTNCKEFNQSSVEKDLTQAFAALLQAFNFDKVNPVVKEIANLFRINLDSIGKMNPKERETFLYEKIYNKVEENIKVIDKMTEEGHPGRNSKKSIVEDKNHFEWLGVTSKYSQLRPIFEEILLQKVKLFDRELTTITQLPNNLPHNSIQRETTARQGFEKSSKVTLMTRSKTISTTLGHKRVQSAIQSEFTNVKIRDKSSFKLSQWTKRQEQQFLAKKALFKSNLKINNIPVLFQFVKKYTETVKARDNIYRKWQQRQKYGITPQELRYLCATSVFLNKTMAKSQKNRIQNNIKAAGPNLISRLELNIAQKIIETYHLLMKRVADLRAKYYEQLTQQRKLQQKESAIVEHEKTKQTKRQQIFHKYKTMFATIVNSDKMKVKLNPKINKWIKHFINNLKKSINKSVKEKQTPNVFVRLTTQNDESTPLYKYKKKFPSAKIIKRQDHYSHRLKYRKYIPSQTFYYDSKFEETISNINKVKLQRNQSHTFYKQLTGGPKKKGDYISVDLSKKKVFLSSPTIIKYIVKIQAKWKAVYAHKKYLALIQQAREQQEKEFQQKLQSLYKIYPSGKKIDMRAIQNRLKRISMKISNVIRPYERVIKRPINVYTSFCHNKQNNLELKNKYARNGTIRIGEFMKLVENNQFNLLKKSGLVVTSKEINNPVMKNGTNAMWWAVYHSNLSLTTLFLQGGGDPNSKDNDGETCLHVAVKNGAVPIIFILLDYGGDLNRKNNNKYNPLFFASLRMLKLLGLEQGSVAGDRDNNSTFYRRSQHGENYRQHFY